MKVCNFTVSLLNIHEQYYLSWAMWLAAAMQSQSLPSFQEPRSRLLMNLQNFIQILFIPLIGLSKERPILGDHPKAHIHEICRISGEIQQILCGFQVKSGGFHADFTWNLPDFMWISPEICQISWNPLDFMRISKDQLPGMVSLMFWYFSKFYYRGTL